MTTDEKYQEAVSGIALARETVRQVTRAIRDGMDAGDDPVIILHNMAGSLSKEAPFQTGGHGAAVFVTACFLLAESGFFDPKAVEAGDPMLDAMVAEEFESWERERNGGAAE